MSQGEIKHLQESEVLDEVALCAKAAGLDLAKTQELANFAREKNIPLVISLVERVGVAEETILCRLGEWMGIPSLTEEPKEISEEILKSMSPGLAMRYRVMPFDQQNSTLRVACPDPFHWQQWDELQHILGRPLEKVLCPTTLVDRMLNTFYGIGADTVERLVSGHEQSGLLSVTEEKGDLAEEKAANEPTVVNLVNKILLEAMRLNATDIHFEPYENKYRIRYRVDGMLEDVPMPASVKMLKLAVVSRIKIMSNLDIAEKRLPQDGRCQVSLGGREYDLRISILPRLQGEAIVIRLQSRQMMQLGLDDLGFEQEERNRVETLVSRPYGLILVTGPTGSGKTTTLYSCLHRIASPTVKIITIEDPVEYWMEDIVQLQVHEEIGFTFARALRGILRHDPDIVLVGEIRDRETADMAIRSSLTGHLVFASLHTNDAANAATRLIDIGIEPFLVSSSVQGVVAQRLVRKVCTYCRREVDRSTLNDYQRRVLQENAGLENVVLWEGEGCKKCRFSGYRGRVAVGEVLMVSPAIKECIQKNAPSEEIKTLARKEGMRTLRESAFLTLQRGITSLAEVLRVTQEDF